MRHLFFSLETIPYLRLKLEWGKEGILGSTRRREKLLEGRVFQRVRHHFLPSYHGLSATS